MKELTELRRDYSEHLKQCTHNQAKQANINTTNTSSEDERTTGSENGTNVTEPETASPPGSSERKSGEEKTKRVEDTAIETSVPVQ
jgi:hypothetical protein